MGSSAVPSLSFPPPDVPDHELIRRIGRGAYGEVWIARSVTGAYRAVKIVHRASFDHDRPFDREFEGILKFEPISRHHDSQVDILHVGRGEDCFYYVMELADDQATGGQILDPDSYKPRTIKSDLLFRSRLPFEECVQIGVALTTALEHLHANGLVHRDVKPSNIIFVNGVAKLADIGLVTGVDATRSYVGTEGFAAPEGPGTAQADLFSLGKVLYEMATGKDRQEFPELPTLLRELPDREGLMELNAVIAQACRHDPKDRYASASAMRADLELLQSGKSLARLHRLERRLRFARRAGVLATVLVGVIAVGWFWQARQTARVRELAAENLTLADRANASAVLARKNEETARENLYAADINLAHQALLTDNFRQAHDLLQSHLPKPGEPDERGWEWRYLWRQCQSDELSGWQGHEQAATSVAFSPEGSRLVSGSYDGSAKVWEAGGHALLATLSGHTGIVQTVTFSPQGTLIATGSKDMLRLWDTATFQPVRTIPQFTLKARFSPTGDYLLTGGTNLVLWDTRTWEVVNTRALPEFQEGEKRLEGAGFGVAFSPDGQRIGLVLEDGVALLSVPDLKFQGVLEDPMPHGRFLSFSPDGRTLATCTMGHEVKLWDIELKKVLRTFSGHSGTVDVGVFSPDGRLLATCSLDQTVKLWDVATGTLLRTYKGHAEEVWDVSFSPDGRLLTSVSKDGAVKLWDSLTRSMESVELNAFLPLGFDPAGNLVGKGNSLGLVTVDPQTLHKVSIQELDPGPLVQLGHLSSDGHTLAIPLTGRDEVEVWDLQRHQAVCSVAGRSRRAAVVFAPKLQLLATATTNRTVTLWQLPQGVPRCVLTNTSFPVVFSTDGHALVTRGVGGDEFKLWKLEAHDGRIAVEQGPPVEGLWAAAFSPDGRVLACGEWGGSVRLFALPSGAEMPRLVGHKRDVAGISFSPDGRTLATISDDGTVRLWHVRTWRELMRFQTPMKDPRGPSLAFSPDGRTLVADTDDRGERRTYVWHAPSFTAE